MIPAGRVTGWTGLDGVEGDRLAVIPAGSDPAGG